MVADERFNITFNKVMAAAKKYQDTGYNDSYMKVYDRAFRAKLIDDPDEDSVRQLIKFVNSWRNRTPYSTLPDLLAVLSRNAERNALLRNVVLESPALDESNLQAVQDVFEELCRVFNFGPTGASKLLGVIHPKLCVMWDNPIRHIYKYGGNVPEYSHFLGKMRKLALEVIKDATQNHGIANPADYISDKYGFTPSFTLATFINHYVWVTFTLPLQKKSS